MRIRGLGWVFAIASVLPAAAAAQPLPTFEEPAEGETLLLFYSGDDGSEALPISVQDPPADGSTVPREVCTTPCAFRVPNGTYAFLAGSRREFAVAATGGIQQWTVEDNSLGGIIAGAVMTGMGAGLVLPGGLVLAGLLGGGLSDPSLSDDPLVALGQIFAWTFVAIGIGLTVPGVIVWSMAYGGAEMTPRPDLLSGVPVPASGLRLMPGLLTGQAVDGSRVWGLNLTLVF